MPVGALNPCATGATEWESVASTMPPHRQRAHGAVGGSRTHALLRVEHFKCPASTIPPQPRVGWTGLEPVTDGL